MEQKVVSLMVMRKGPHHYHFACPTRHSIDVRTPNLLKEWSA